MLTTLDALSLLQAPFVQRALIIGVIVAVLASVLSIFVVLKKIALIGDGLSHTAFGGLALGYFLSIYPLWIAGITVILGSIGINKALRSTKISGDAAIAVFLQLGLAGGITLLSLAGGFGVNLESLLFGSILIVDWGQIITAAVVAVITLTLVFVFFKEMVYITFDETQARAAGIKTWIFDYLLSILCGVAVVVSIPIVGVLLISALLVLPALISTQIAKSFRQTVMLAPVVGVVTVVLGILASLALDAAPGGTIVLVGLGIFAVTLVTKKVVGLQRKK
jgi:ABC-type Mn2+/Zn2+ transport systems, permease components